MTTRCNGLLFLEEMQIVNSLVSDKEGWCLQSSWGRRLVLAIIVGEDVFISRTFLLYDNTRGAWLIQEGCTLKVKFRKYPSIQLNNIISHSTILPS